VEKMEKAIAEAKASMVAGMEPAEDLSLEAMGAWAWDSDDSSEEYS
jgi:hypothetical protein